MRRKTRNIVTACLSLAASACLALSAVFALPKSVTADTTPSTAADLISSSNATITAKQTFNSHVNKPLTGLGVVSGTPYSAEFNTVFDGDLYFKYLFPDYDEKATAAMTGTSNKHGTDRDGKNGNFKFTITSVTDSSVYCDFIYTANANSGNNTPNVISMVAEYHVGEDTYYRTIANTWTTNAATGGYNWSTAKTTSPLMLKTGYNFAGNGVFNDILFSWTDNVLRVTSGYGGSWANGALATAASTFNLITFDGKETFSTTDCAVPLFPQGGFTLSFSSEYETGTDVVFTEINGVSMASDVDLTTDADTIDGKGIVAVENGKTQVVRKGDELNVQSGSDIAFYNATFNSVPALAYNATGKVYAPVIGDSWAYTGGLNTSVPATYTCTSTTDGEFSFTVKVNSSQTVTYMANGEQYKQVPATYGGAVFLPDSDEMDETAAAGKVFRGWTDEQGTLYEGGALVENLTENRTFTAYYKDCYTVTYMQNETPTTATAVDGEDFTLVVGDAQYAPDGKVFVGWVTAEGEMLYAGDVVTLSEATTYTAGYMTADSSALSGDISTLITSSNATVTANKTFNQTVGTPVTGLGVESTAPYSATFDAVFTGDLQLEYVFPNNDGVKDTAANKVVEDRDGKNGNFKFTITDATDPTNYFDLIFSYNDAGTTGTIGLVAVYHAADKKTYCRTLGGYWQANMFKSFEEKDALTAWKGNGTGSNSLPSGYNSTRSKPNTLALTWTDDVLLVTTDRAYRSDGDTKMSALGEIGTGGPSCIIKFDGLTGDPGLSNQNCYVPKFPKQYIVSFSSEWETGTDIVFTKINGHTTTELSALTADTANDFYVSNAQGDRMNSGEEVTMLTGEALSVTQTALFGYNELALSGNYNGSISKRVSSAFEYAGNATNGATITSKVNPYYNLTVKEVEKVTVEYVVNGATVSTVHVGQGDRITLQSAPVVAGKIFVGWIKQGGVNDGILKANGVYDNVEASIVFEAVCIDMELIAGASVRKTDPTGIRFTTKIAAADYALIKNSAVFGTLIAPLDMSSAATLTVGASDCLNIVANNWLSPESVALMGFDAEGYEYFTGVVTNVLPQNLARAFLAKAYVTVTYKDGTDATFYADCNETDNARSIYYVATESLKAGETDALGVLQSYVNAVADITVSGDNVSKANDRATYTVGGSVEENVFTVTVSGQVSALVINGVWISTDQAIQAGDISITLTGVSYENDTTTITFTRN